DRSALRELRGLAGLLETGLLALGDASVAAQVTGLLQLGAVGLRVDLVERASHAQADGTGLAGGSTAGDQQDDVETSAEVQQGEGLIDEQLVQLVRVVLFESASVDGPLSGARDEAGGSNSMLATAHTVSGSGQGLSASTGGGLAQTGGGLAQTGGCGSLGGVFGCDLFVDHVGRVSGISHGSPRDV